MDGMHLGRYFQKFEFQTLSWNAIDRLRKFADSTQMNKNVIGDGDIDGFWIIRYNITRNDEWLFRLEITEDDVNIYIKLEDN